MDLDTVCSSPKLGFLGQYVRWYYCPKQWRCASVCALDSSFHCDRDNRDQGCRNWRPVPSSEALQVRVHGDGARLGQRPPAGAMTSASRDLNAKLASLRFTAISDSFIEKSQLDRKNQDHSPESHYAGDACYHLTPEATQSSPTTEQLTTTLKLPHHFLESPRSLFRGHPLQRPT
eukprot:1894329-Rhodomonas_salina.1